MDYQSFSRKSISDLEKIYRLNLINSVSGYKSANLIGSISEEGTSNLAIFSSVVHLGSDPAILGFIMRPRTVERHTYDNIMSSGYYTINHVDTQHTAMAHYTSAKFPSSHSEFELCRFKEEFIDGFSAPFVKGSPVKMMMKFEQEIPIEINGTIMMVGSIQHLMVSAEAIEESGIINLEKSNTAAISGLNTYYSPQRIAQYPYARVGQPSQNLLKE